MHGLTLFTLHVSQPDCLPARLRYTVFCDAFVSADVFHLSVLAVGADLKERGQKHTHKSLVKVKA